MPIETTGDSIRLEIVHSVYKSKVEYEILSEGEVFPNKKEVLKKQMRVKKWFKKECISSVEEYVTSKNKVARKRSIVFDKYSGKFYATFHSPEEIINKIEHNSCKSPIGFNYDNKIQPAGSQLRQHKKRR